MCVRRLRQTQGLLQKDLSRGACQKVCSTHDMSNPLCRVVDNDCKLIREQPIAPTDHEIAGVGMDIDFYQTLNGILERYDATRYAISVRKCSIRFTYSVPAPAWIVQLVHLATSSGCRLYFRPGARTGICLSCCKKLIKGGLI